MLINADFSRPAIVSPDQYQWMPSRQGGVERVMLDRVGGEKARATSIVRYAPHSSFPRHRHPRGEEILVLSGTFSDEVADYPAGCYLRNPPGSSHRPFSRDGAVIFVKLWQMRPEESRRVRVDTREASCWHQQHGREVCSLFSSDAEQVCLQRLMPSAPLFAEPVQGAELLVLAREVLLDGRSYATGSWMRLPAGAYPGIAAGAQGATVYLKTGHLPDIAAEIRP